MLTAPTVTVLINNHNYARFLGVAIDSALNQTHQPLEVVVVDDGSTDESPDVMRSYGERIKPVFKPNGGQASAFNAGFAASQGEIICLLDADDFFLPEKVERVVLAKRAQPGIGWVFHPVRREGNGHNEVSPKLDATLFSDNCESALRRGKLTGPPGPVTSGIAMSRKLMAHILPMAESIWITADNYLILLAASLATGIYLKDALAVQRIHGNNLYTLRPDRLLMEAGIHLLIAEELRRAQPKLWRLSDHVFSRALAIYLKGGVKDAACRARIRAYVRNASFTEWPDLLLRAAYHRMRGGAMS